MKKGMLFLFLIMVWSEMNGQLYPPIQPYKENDYSLSEVKKFAISQTPLSSSWRKELVGIVNKGLIDAGENMILNDSNICWILDHVSYERVKITNFENSRNISNKVTFYHDSIFDGMVGIFKYRKCNLVIFKTRCMNLLKVPIIVQDGALEQVDPVEIEKDSSWEMIPPSQEYKRIEIPSYFPEYIPKKKSNSNFWKICKIGGITVGFAGLGYLIYRLIKKGDSSRNVPPPVIKGHGIDPPPNSGDDEGGPVDPPPNDGGDQGGPVDPYPNDGNGGGSVDPLPFGN